MVQLRAQGDAGAGVGDPGIADEKIALSRAREQARAAAARAESLESEAANARDDAAKVRAKAAAIAARIQAAEADITEAEAQIGLIEAQRREQRARLAEKQWPTTRLIAALQTLGMRPQAAALVQPGSLDDLVHLQAVLSSVRPAIEARTATLRTDVARGTALRAEADRALAALGAGQQALITQRNALAALAAERTKVAEKLAGSAMVEQDKALAMGEEVRDIGTLMARMSDAASVRARLETLDGPVLRPLRPGDPRPVPTDRSDGGGQATYRLPVIGRVIAGMGEVSENGIRARGLTIATRSGAQVVAPTGGRIAFAGPYRGYGNIIIIDHGRGWTTLITGLAAIDARVGETVAQGSPVGHAGPTRPTITVELRRQGQPVDLTRLIG